MDTRDGVVTLFGATESEAKKQAAAEQARQIDGVKAVKNEIQVVRPRSL